MSEGPTMLHTVNKSPFERNTLESCLRLAVKGSGILLLEDGVYAALRDTSASDRIGGAVEDYRVFVLGPDIEARGLGAKALIDGVTVVDYSGFADLVAEHDAVHAWL